MATAYVLTGDPTQTPLSEFITSLSGAAIVQYFPHTAPDPFEEPTPLALGVDELASALRASVLGDQDPVLSLTAAVRVMDQGPAVAILAVRAADRPLGPDEVLGLELLGKPPGFHLVLDESGRIVR